MSRSAIVQDWFFTPGGSEQVAFEVAGLLRDVDLYTSFADAPSIARLGPRLHMWPLQHAFPGTRAYRRFLPLYPLWFGGLDMTGYDLVVSSSSAFAKAVRTRSDAIHVAFIHTPMRYGWDLEGYLEGSSLSLVGRLAARMLRSWLQRWDRETSKRPDVLVANSLVVRDRIRRFWGRDAEIIHPPVDVHQIELGTTDDGYLLVAARMLAYRRLDQAIEAASRLARDLVVVGDGPERRRLRAIAGPRVRFTGTVDRRTLLDLFAHCHAYLVPGVEDFGIAPVEAMAAGKPVVAFGQGGAAETVVDGVTGVLYPSQTTEGLVQGIERLERLSFNRAVIRRRAEEFDTSVFLAAWRSLFERLGVDPSLYSAG